MATIKIRKLYVGKEYPAIRIDPPKNSGLAKAFKPTPHPPLTTSDITQINPKVRTS
jgi:hypothetical protein